MAINEQGYVRPTYDELLAERISIAQELFGDDIDTTDASALGKFIRLAVQDLADAYEAQEIIYYSRFPHTATGQSLDRLMPFAGISRNPATRAEHEIAFTGTAGYTILDGFIVGTTGDERFYLANDVTLDENGEGVGIVICTEAGEIGNVAPGDITEIINPDAEVTGIEHTAIEVFGEEVESDEDLRKRFRVAIEGTGSGTASSIRGAVMRITGVEGCSIVENNTSETVDGRPPHSFEVFVYAEDIDSKKQEIAEAIFEKKPLGIRSWGDDSANVEDASGGTQTVYFSPVTETEIYVMATVTTNDDFELDGEAKISDALVDYVNSLTTGDDVIYASLYKYIFSVVGVVDVPALSISTDGSSYVTQNIVLDKNTIARTNSGLVELTINYN